MSRTVTLRRRGALGDVILLGAVTGALAKQGDEVWVATHPRYQSVARRLVGVTGVCDWDAAAEGWTIDLDGGLRGRRMRADARIDKHSLRRRLWRWTGWVHPRPPVPQLYGEAAGVPPVPAPWIPSAGSQAREVLALVPGAAWAPKQWNEDGWTGLAQRWSGPIVVLGGPGEEALVNAVASRLPAATALVESGFEQTIAWLHRSAVAVAGDTGLMHLAGACGAQVIALFGPTHPDDGFFVYSGGVVQQEVGCRPCTLHRVERCKAGHHRCMQHPIDGVWEAVQDALGRTDR